MDIVVKFQGVRSLAIPPAPRHTRVGVVQFAENLPGRHFPFQASDICCDSVAMRAVSSRCQLKSLRDERWRRPLSHRETGERAVPTRKEITTPARNGGPGLHVQGSVWRSCGSSPALGTQAPRTEWRVRPLAPLQERPCERTASRRKRTLCGLCQSVYD